MPDEDQLSLRQADQIRGDLYGLQDDLDFISLASGIPASHASGSSIFFCMAITFPPAENARPAPVRTTTCTSGSSLTSSQMRDIEVCIGPVNALRVSGEFKVMVSTLSCRATSTPPYWE